MIVIKKYTADQKNQWDEFVKKAKNGTFLFQRDFMEYHQDRFEDFSLMIYKDDILFALVPANVNEDVLYSHQGLTYGSFVLLKKAKLLDTFEAFKKMLEYLYEAKINQFDIRIIPSFYNAVPADELEYFLFKANAELLKRDALMVIDYQDRIKFQKNRREGINKAIRNNLKVQVDANYEGFWNEILIPNLNNKHGADPVHTLDEIKLLALRFPENIKQVNVYKEGKIVAGTTVFLTKTTVHPQYVSGNMEKNAFGSLDLVYDFIISKFSNDRRYFDFNTSSEEGGAKLNKGLIFWKESCGARTFVSNNYRVNTEVYKTLSLQTI